MTFMLENLEVYQKAVSFADAIAALTHDFPRGFGFLADQLSRAALSIATNLADGNGRFTKPDRKNFFTIARGSAQECVPLLEVAQRRGLIDQSKHEALREDLETIAKMISGALPRGFGPVRPRCGGHSSELLALRFVGRSSGSGQ